MHCFKCGKPLENCLGAEYDPLPGSALVFTAYGNYGSTIFDPPPEPFKEEKLEIYICDACVKLQAKFVVGYRNFRPAPVEELIRS